MTKEKKKNLDFLVANIMQYRKNQFVNDKSLLLIDVNGMLLGRRAFLVSSLRRSQKAPFVVHLQSSKTRRRKLGLSSCDASDQSLYYLFLATITVSPDEQR